MSSAATPAATCRNCGAKLPPRTSYCTVCGAAVYNRAGLAASKQEEDPELYENPNKVQIPGIVAVTPYQRKPLVAPKAETDFDVETEKVTVAGAGRRLSAKLLDMVIPLILNTVGAIVGAITISVKRINDQTVTVDLLGLVIWAGSATLLSLIYWVLIWIWEGKTGKTLGNLILGIRTTNMEGKLPGIASIFVRDLLISIAFGVAFIGGVIMMISNLWDKNGKRQGWHDKAARTLVFDVRKGRDPLLSEGVSGPAKFVDSQIPMMLPVSIPGSARVPGQEVPGSRVTGPRVTGPRAEQPQVDAGVQMGSAGQPGSSIQPAQGGRASQPLSSTTAGGEGMFAPQVIDPGTPNGAWNGPQHRERTAPLPGGTPQQPVTPTQPAAQMQQPDQQSFGTTAENQNEPLDRTSLRAAWSAPQLAEPVTHGEGLSEDPGGQVRAVHRVMLDDGRIIDVVGVVLIGRNPAAYSGEFVDELVDVPDQSRSISKTHLRLKAAPEGLLVSDRKSTNGSFVVRIDGVRIQLLPGEDVLVRHGESVIFGDRRLSVGPA